MQKSLIIIAIFFISSIVLAQEEISFIYEENVRDPFMPLVSKDGKLMVTYGAINSINDIILEGILFDAGGESVVVMNDLVLKVNDHVGNIKVKHIKENEVIILFKGEEYTLKPKE